MAQIQNLLDMFLNTRKDAQAKGARPPESKSRPSAGTGGLLPIQPSSGKKPGPEAFHARVEESRAKLAAKAGTPPPHHRIPDTSGPRPDSRARETSHAAPDRTESAERRNRPEHPRTRDRAGTRHDAMRKDPPRDDDGMRVDAPDAHEAPEDASSAQRNADAGTARPMDEKEMQELKDGLEKLGIHATDEQLQDPAFLLEMLQMLQGLSGGQEQAALTALPQTDSEPTQAEAAAQEPAPADPDLAALADAMTAPGTGTEAAEPAATLPGGTGPSVTNSAADPAVDAAVDPALNPEVDTATDIGQETKPLDRKALAALIRDRLNAIAGKPMDAAGNTPGMAAGPAATAAVGAPTDLKGLRIRPQEESVTTQPLPMADLDRMRVLQAAALQAGHGAKGPDSAVLPTEGKGDASADAIGDVGHTVAPAAEGETDEGSFANGDLSDGNADLFGGKGETSGNAGAAAPKDGAMAGKDGSIGPQFQNSLDQARAFDSRMAAQRGPEARPAFAQTALEQIAKKLSAVAHKNGDEINIQLSPEHLGKVRVSLEMKDGAMSARIGVENDQVRQQVEAGIAALKDALQNQGIKLQGLEVSVDQRQGSLFNPDGSNSQSFFHRNGRGGNGGGESGAEVAPFESAPESDTGRRWGYNTMEYIG